MRNIVLISTLTYIQLTLDSLFSETILHFAADSILLAPGFESERSTPKATEQIYGESNMNIMMH